MEQDIFPLEQQLSKLSCNKKDKFAAPRRQRSRSVTLTPGVRIVKPSQQAFHSTGLLSKKHRILKETTPDTPIKHKQILDSIGLQPSLNTPAKFQSMQQYSGSTPVDTPASIKNSRLHFRSPLAESPTNSTKRQHYIEVPSPLRQEYLAPSHTDSMKRANDHRELTNSDEHNRQYPYQPPIAIYGAYNSDDTPESSRFDSSIAKNSFFHHINIKRHNSAKKVHHTPNPITFHMFVSRHRIQISKGFFQALEGREPYLSDFLRQYDNGASDQDYFETNFELLGRLGHGAFADAFHVIDMNDNAEYAIKKTRQPFTGYKDCLKKLEEVKMLLHIGVHPQCISLKSAWLQFGFLYMQLELCNMGNLLTYLEEYCSNGALTEDQLWRIMADVLKGIDHIHRHGIVHLDLKPANIFITAAGTLKIGDFGLSAFAPIINDDREGDRTYLAPEILNGSIVSYPADIFRFSKLNSFGLMVLEIAANVVLPENGPIWQQLREGNLEGIIFLDKSQMMTDFIKATINADPSSRPTAADLLKHPRITVL